jgi:hypothetical protein
MKQDSEEGLGKKLILGTIFFVGIVILIFGGVQIANKQILAGSLIIAIGVFDLIIGIFVAKYLL